MGWCLFRLVQSKLTRRTVSWILGASCLVRVLKAGSGQMYHSSNLKTTQLKFMKGKSGKLLNFFCPETKGLHPPAVFHQRRRQPPLNKKNRLHTGPPRNIGTQRIGFEHSPLPEKLEIQFQTQRHPKGMRYIKQHMCMYIVYVCMYIYIYVFVYIWYMCMHRYTMSQLTCERVSILHISPAQQSYIATF